MQARSMSTVRRRLLGMLLVAAGLCTSLVAPDPAAAAPPATYSDALVFWPTSSSTLVAWRNGVKTTKTVTPAAWGITGQMAGPPGANVLLYNPGSAADTMVRVVPNGSLGVTLSSSSASISGNFRPLVGDFDGNGYDDVFWYAAGSAPDYLWLFNSAGNHTTKSASVNGTYRPVVIDAGLSGADDIIWYGPGPASDSLWRFDNAGNHVTSSISIGGNYVPIVGNFGSYDSGVRDLQVVWYDPAGADSIWVFYDDGTHTSGALPALDGDYLPVVGRFSTSTFNQDILWYRPGTGAEKMWSFVTDGVATPVTAPTVNGTYVPAVGDFDNNGYDDIAWSGVGSATVWTYTSAGHGQTVISGLPAGAMPVAVRPSYVF